MTKDNAFSGLEAAIVLIAFVVVAAVFSYVMLGAGFFATQKSQEVTYSGIKQATSNMVVDGSLYGQMGGSSSAWLSTVKFYLSIPEGGQPQDLDDVEYGVTVEGAKYQYATATATKKFKIDIGSGDADTNHILKAGGKNEMTLTFHTDDGPEAGEEFTLEIRPSVGAASLLTKKLISGYTGGPII